MNKQDDLIEYIKNNSKLCDTFCCYEDCDKCVRKYIKYLIEKDEIKLDK